MLGFYLYLSICQALTGAIGSRDSKLRKPNLLSFNITEVCKKSVEYGRELANLSRDDFEDFQSSNGCWFDQKGQTLYAYSTELTDEHFWLHAYFGKPSPLSPKLVNINNFEMVQNERTPEQAELTNSLFALIAFERQRLYLAPGDLATQFVRLLGSRTPSFSQDIKTRGVYVSPEDFASKLSKVERIQFTSGSPHMFDEGLNGARELLNDLTRANAPTDFTLTIDAKYDFKSIKDFLFRLLEARRSNAIKSLVIKGLDEHKMKMVFNQDTFLKHIVIQADKDDNGLYSSFEINRIKERLLNEVDKDNE